MVTGRLADWQMLVLGLAWVPMAILSIGSLFKAVGRLPWSIRVWFAGGALSRIAFFPGIGGGLAIACAWVGLQRFGRSADTETLMETAVSNAGEILFLVALAPALAMAAVVYITVKYAPSDDAV